MSQHYNKIVVQMQNRYEKGTFKKFYNVRVYAQDFLGNVVDSYDFAEATTKHGASENIKMEEAVEHFRLNGWEDGRKS